MDLSDLQLFSVSKHGSPTIQFNSNSTKLEHAPSCITTSQKNSSCSKISASGGLVGRPDTTVTYVIPVSVPCFLKTPLKKQANSCFCSFNQSSHGKTYRCLPQFGIRNGIFIE